MAKATKPGLEVDEDLIRKLADLLDDTGLGEIEVQDGDRKLRVAKAGSAVSFASPAAAAPMPAAGAVVAPIVPAADDYATHPGAVKSPMVGVCYLSPDPKSEMFCQEGDTVAEGDTLLLIEAMKVFNSISAPKSGKVVKILVRDGMPVEYGEPLVIVE